MSIRLELQESRVAWTAPPCKPLDEAVWQAWLKKGRAQEARSRAVHMTIVKWISLAALFAASAFGPQLGPYHSVPRFIVTAGALLLMFRALRSRRPVFSIAFGALALFYNPIFPVFSFSGEWQRALVMASAAPFAASLALRNAGEEPNA